MIRMGEKYIFDTRGTDSTWKAWDGQECTVIRLLTKEEADIDDIGLMWVVRFEDEQHTVGAAFDDELYGPYTAKRSLVNKEMAAAMIYDLRFGRIADNGDRMSEYFNIAENADGTAFVIPSEQGKAVEKKLDNCNSVRAVIKAVKELLREKRVKMGSGQDKYIYLNEKTLTILRSSELGKYAAEFEEAD